MQYLHPTLQNKLGLQYSTRMLKTTPSCKKSEQAETCCGCSLTFDQMIHLTIITVIN